MGEGRCRRRGKEGRQAECVLARGRGEEDRRAHLRKGGARAGRQLAAAAAASANPYWLNSLLSASLARRSHFVKEALFSLSLTLFLSLSLSPRTRVYLGEQIM